LVQAHFARLSAVADELSADSEATKLLASTSVQLVRALIASTGLDNAPSRTVAHDTLFSTVMTYVRQHLRDPRMTPRTIATANNISVRLLHNLWAENGESVNDWIIRERLEGARRDLAVPSSLLVTVEVVARRWGFVDPSHFSRRFRQAYGLSPREWRMSRASTIVAPATLQTPPDAEDLRC
jgi:AraC-like DNA-binding protein